MATQRWAGADRLDRGLVGLAALASALLAGFFYAYACSVMVGLALVDDRTFVVTMRSINATVRNAAFAPSFFGALVLPVAAAVVLGIRRSPARNWVLAAGVLAVGAFAVTMLANVPLNAALAAAAPTEPGPARAAFEEPWVAWNLVRTGLATGALITLLRALTVLPRRGVPKYYRA